MVDFVVRDQQVIRRSGGAEHAIQHIAAAATLSRSILKPEIDCRVACGGYAENNDPADSGSQ